MATGPIAMPQVAEDDFHVDRVITIAGGHFVHDTFTAFVSPLLPLIIANLSISLTQAGTFSAAMQLPSLINPFIGYLDDKLNLRWLTIIAPAVTATTIGWIGLTPNYLGLVVLFSITGLSIAAFHATAPALIARTSGRKVGKGMSFFMAGGELGRTVGPLLAVWAVSMWAMKGILPLAALGWLASAILYIRFRSIPLAVMRRTSMKGMLPGAARFFIPIALIMVCRNLLVSGIGVYLPTFLSHSGASLWTAGSSLALYQMTGVAGAFLGGTLSDRIGRKPILWVMMISSALLVILFLKSTGWMSIMLLLLLGFTNLSTQPVLLALVQDYFPHHRSVANGVFLAISFLSLSLTSILVGFLGDRLGLGGAFFWCGIFSLGAAPLLWALPPLHLDRLTQSSELSR